jgi:putative membrane protein insertion efficiency factor
VTTRIARRFALLLVHAYQLLLSPFAGGACRFEPSCSAYAAEAIEIHGALRGGWLAVRRVARCHPFATPGLDPVPPVALDRGSNAAVKIRG